MLENPQGQQGQNLSPKQLAAIRKAKELAEKIADSHPEIADEYRQGLTSPEIIKKNGLDKIGYSIKIIRTAVSLALKKLIPDEEERAKLRDEKKQLNGIRAKKAGIGVHGLTVEEKRLNSQKAGQETKKSGKGIFALSKDELISAGKKLVEEGKGIHAYTPEERSELGKKNHALGVGIHGMTTEQRVEGGKRLHEKKQGVHGKSPEERKDYAKKSVESRGLMPWRNHAVETTTRLDEYDYCLKLLEDPAYKKMHKGVLMVDRSKVVEELNNIFHDGKPVRTPGAISSILQEKKERS